MPYLVPDGRWLVFVPDRP
ncbi:hypothetical protein HAP95_10800 [Acidithiobacillus sp. RW2]|uniref:Uncharacterized protein n=1 Tax=Acidithiobacillus sulfurivorans TaxID=1958756 RepID=A0ABS5ZZM1_9PROT|nr:hypothetical protein [Acidithiobacillus sulfurivorans]